jgi:DNA-binding transcriptional LysR family regulator
MPRASTWFNIDLHLVRVLDAVVSERSVSRAAMKLGTTQPVVSAQLRRLRTLVGDALIVRAGTQWVPTEAALRLVGPARQLLLDAESLFTPSARADFQPARSTATVRLAASDYLDPLFLPHLVARLHMLSPGLRLELEPLSGSFDLAARLAGGQADLVIGNWLEPPEELHLGRLLSDEVVCLVAQDHPAAREPRQWTMERFLDSDHVAPAAMHVGWRGVIDEQLQRQGLERRIAVRAAHFSLIPEMVARTRLVLTTGRQFCQRYVGQLPLRIVRCPVPMPPMAYYQLWHARTHRSPIQQWLREQVRDVARELADEPARARRAARTAGRTVS